MGWPLDRSTTACDKESKAILESNPLKEKKQILHRPQTYKFVEFLNIDMKKFIEVRLDHYSIAGSNLLTTDNVIKKQLYTPWNGGVQNAVLSSVARFIYHRNRS